MPGRLVVIPTPIGNLEDLSARVIQALGSCDLLLCEDTRVTGKLLAAKAIDAELRSFHEHNEASSIEQVVERISGGAVVGLVSDAGTPLLSDPGFPLVAAAVEAGLTVEAIPGPFAGVTALSGSGLPPHPFVFYGFLPRKRGERLRQFGQLRELGMTAIFYESPHRIVSTLRDLGETLPDARVVVARELTKLHEEYLRGTAELVADILEQRDRIRGEITLLVGPVTRERTETSREEILEAYSELSSSGVRKPEAARILAERFGVPRREIYEMISREG